MQRLMITNVSMITALLLVSACSPNTKNDNFSKISEEEFNESQKAELESLVQQQLEQRDENGNLQDLQGFTKAEKLGTDDANMLANDDFKELIQSDEQIFEFQPPEGIDAEFSEPVMVVGASLLLANGDIKSQCENLEYFKDEPTMKDIVEYSQKTNTCGDVTVNFCIRLKMVNSIIPDRPNYTYTESPDLNLNLPCPGDSFKDLRIDIANGASHTNKTTEKVKISSARSVISVYLTNSPGCFDGGEWQDIRREDPDWNLEFVDNSATVYAKFADIFEIESECVSDSIAYGSTTDQCFADDPGYLADNILSGVSIGGVEGTATLSYPTCTEDGQVGCIASAAYKAVGSNGLAMKVMTGQTVGGVVGSVAIETHSNCTAGGQDDCITTATYASMDLSAMDAGGAVDLTSSNFSTQVKSAATFEFWDDTGTRHTATGDTDIVGANVLNNAEIFGITGTAGASPDCSSITGSGTWILVPGDQDYGTNDFCVMKYEAKNNSNVPTSTASGSPWTSISQQDAKTECASLGKGYHLITNDEWMTIATNAASQNSNWSGGTVGSGTLYRGHSDNSPTVACPAGSIDDNAYVEDDAGTDCTAYASGTENDEATQRRTHTLSNGQVIWDLSGNVWEWTSYFNDDEKPTPLDSTDEFSNLTGTTTMPLTDLIPNNAVKSFWDDDWNSTEAIGRYTPGSDASGGALRRGGRWGSTSSAGIFTVNMSDSPTTVRANLGFRCAIAVP